MSTIFSQTYDFTKKEGRPIKRGQTLTQGFKVKVGGTYVDFVGKTPQASVRKKEDENSDAIATATATVDPTDTERIIFAISETETAAVTENRGFYDILLPDTSEDIYYLRGQLDFYGRVTVKA